MLIALARFLNAPQPLIGYIPRVLAILFAGVIPLGLLAALFLPDTMTAETDETLRNFTLSVIVAPLLETLMMWPLLALLKWLRLNDWAAAGISGLCWGALHLMNTVQAMPPLTWTFFILSLVFLAWRRVSIFHAVGVTAAVHAAYNFLILMLVGFSG